MRRRRRRSLSPRMRALIVRYGTPFWGGNRMNGLTWDESERLYRIMARRLLSGRSHRGSSPSLPPA